MRHNMMRGPLNCLLYGLLTLGITASTYSMVLAGEEEDMAAMQKAMNQQTMDKLYAMRMRGMAAGSGTGGKTGRWTGGSKKDGCWAWRAWKTSTSARHEAWTGKWCDR